MGVRGRTKNTPREGEATEIGERSVIWKRNQCRSQTYNKRPKLIEQRCVGSTEKRVCWLADGKSEINRVD